MDFDSSNCIPILIGGNKQGYLVGMIVKIPKRLVYAELAQLGERLSYKQEVTGSNPVLRTILGVRIMKKALNKKFDRSSKFEVRKFSYIIERNKKGDNIWEL